MTRIYLAVSADKYELPIDFDINADRLAERLGVKSNYIYHEIWSGNKDKDRRKGRFRFYKVIINDEDET